MQTNRTVSLAPSKENSDVFLSEDFSSFHTENASHYIQFEVKKFTADKKDFPYQEMDKYALIVHTKHYCLATDNVTRLSYFLGEFYRKVDVMIFANFVLSNYEKVGLAACPIADPEHHLLG